ncbi:Holliday junction branch migration protein RuvA [Aerococcaceae bacterium zg-ZJ1578]|uniref:Holliday junction branch migration protein RuvA n=1 Tax=Aerococcaceae TaxID=186827 RepID=UPI0013BA16ED|nr:MULTISPECIES: Holliday junction branch migration protein RuvA [unclassified Facklamia]MBK0348416.1 Holliday junction branch migration protein RuvA [Aerococcaceae bacterium zg-1578]NEW64297.1 Holliday junction branch migration protein RuvA [Facklamia sp. 252]NEW67866.1 Holliday junction branch migration protein RuvA [Facklamia sp. 253]QQD64762.1 Holliday junction branch migration protein RuvA [Aerococcaceae bacterium zg-252]
MFEYLIGQVTHIAPTYLVIEVNQIGYRVLVPNPFRFQELMHQTAIKLYVEQVVREDSQTLYGFKTLEEKGLFLTLNKVSGIGPKSALSILAADDHEGLVQAIESGDSQYLTKFPGVGKKTAQQMVLDLKGELGDFMGTETTAVSTANTAKMDLLPEVFEALMGLGYSAREIKRIEKPLKDAQLTSTQDALSLAFKLLLNK